MFIELVDLLRCPASHDETWLVASVDHMDERFITEGRLGCPVCSAEYPIRKGITFFSAPPDRTHAPAAANEREAVRLAAALGLTEPRTVAVIQGRWTAHLPLILAISPSRLMALNPVAVASGVSTIVADSAIFAGSSLGAAAFDEQASPATIRGLVRALGPGGRALGPSTEPIPEGLREVARDEDIWVAERIGPLPSLVPIARRAG